MKPSDMILSQGWTQEVAYATEFGLKVPANLLELSAVPKYPNNPLTQNPDFQYWETGSEVELDPFYVFKKDHIKAVQLWLFGTYKNLMIDGPTGSGKSSFIEQISARLNWPLFDIASSGSTEVEEMLTSRGLQNGSTVWEEGPAMQAMRYGGILLLDEANAIDPSQMIGLHKLLDHRGFIGKDGKRIMPHPAFRVVMIGNAIDGSNASSYAGTNRHMNIATKNRFDLCIKMDYISKEEELEILNRMFPQNEVSEGSRKLIVDFAIATRMSHKGGDLSEPMTTRKVIAAAKWFQMSETAIKRDGANGFINIFQHIYINMLPFREQKVVLDNLKGILKVYGIQ